MTNPSDPLPDPDPGLIPPSHVQAILDEATIPGGLYSAMPVEDGVLLIETATKRALRKANWPRAGEWARNIIRNAVTATREAASETPNVPETPPNA